jgi:hypothetical protein
MPPKAHKTSYELLHTTRAIKTSQNKPFLFRRAIAHHHESL